MRDDELDAILEPFLSSDLARDVANVYGERRQYGVDAGPATVEVFRHFMDLVDDANEGPVIFLALAALQLRDNNLLATIRDTALKLIESGAAQRAWRPTDFRAIRGRKTALEGIATLLQESAVH